MKKIYIICSLAVFLGIAGGISFFLIRDASAQIPEEITLVTQNGDTYNFGEDKTKLKLVEFIYTHCPDICPTTTQKMNSLKTDLEKAGFLEKMLNFLPLPLTRTATLLNYYKDI